MKMEWNKPFHILNKKEQFISTEQLDFFDANAYQIIKVYWSLKIYLVHTATEPMK